MYLEEGCYVDLVTPFKKDGRVDYKALEKNIHFCIKEGVSGIFLVGLAGESPTLTGREHKEVLKRGTAFARCFGGQGVEVFCGTGSNSLKEALEYTRAAKNSGCDGVVLVDPYYNRPPSKHLKMHYRDIAAKNRLLKIVPCTFPSLTGTSLAPEDLRDIDSANICGVIREVQRSYRDVKEVKEVCSADFGIFSAQDDKTLKMMSDKSIGSRGVFSVVANIAPRAVQSMTEALLEGNMAKARSINEALKPFYRIIHVGEVRVVDKKNIVDRYPSPLPIKALMRGMGIIEGDCRLPLYKMSGGGVSQVREAVKIVWQKNPWVLEPMQHYYGVNIEERICEDRCWEEVTNKNSEAVF